MAIYLITAYGIFCTLPLALTIVIKIRRRNVERAIRRLTQENKPSQY
jgi:hypothetical protein